MARPLTIIFDKTNYSIRHNRGLDTVAIRMPRHPVALSIIEQSGVPIAAQVLIFQEGLVRFVPKMSLKIWMAGLI